MGKTWKMRNSRTGVCIWVTEAERRELPVEWVTVHEGLYSVVAEDPKAGPDEVLLENASLAQAERELCRALNEGLDAYITGPY